VNAILRLNYSNTPEELSNEAWARLFNEWSYCERLKNKTLELVIKNAVSEVAASVFGKQ